MVFDDDDGVTDYIGTPDEIYCSECDVWGDHEDDDHN